MSSFSFAASDRLLVLAPHPDDEVLGAGAAILAAREAGVPVRVAFATDGEGNVWVQRLLERRLRIGSEDRARFGRRRRAEGASASAVLGVPPEAIDFLGLPDTDLAGLLRRGDDRIRAAVLSLLRRIEPTVVVGPSPRDVHPDHGALGVVVRGIVRSGEGPASLRALLEFCVHEGRDPSPGDLEFAPRRPFDLRTALSRHEAPMSVHARAFRARVARPLRLTRADGRGAGDPRHPVLCGARLEGGLRLGIRSLPRGGVGRPRDLVLVAAARGRPLRTFVVPLRGSTPEAPVLEPAVGAARGVASVRRGGDRLLVDLPVPDAGAAAWFAKVERPGLFYDAAGWLEVPEAAAPYPMPVRPAPSARVVAVVPCYDVAAHCGAVVEETARRCRRVLAVDDGSTDGTADVLARCAAADPDRVRVLTFEHNRGKGAALLEAFRHALQTETFDVLVTIDADGQHRPADLPRLVEACAAGAHLAIGGRDAFERMPLRSRLGNTLTSVLLRRCFARCPMDTQSGLRAHSRDLVARVVRDASAGRYETETEILLIALAARLPVASVPIPALYIDGNRSSHFRPLRDGVRVWAAIARRRLALRLLGRGVAASTHSSLDPAPRMPRSFGVPPRTRRLPRAVARFGPGLLR